MEDNNQPTANTLGKSRGDQHSDLTLVSLLSISDGDQHYFNLDRRQRPWEAC